MIDILVVVAVLTSIPVTLFAIRGVLVTFGLSTTGEATKNVDAAPHPDTQQTATAREQRYMRFNRLHVRFPADPDVQALIADAMVLDQQVLSMVAILDRVLTWEGCHERKTSEPEAK